VETPSTCDLSIPCRTPLLGTPSSSSLRLGMAPRLTCPHKAKDTQWHMSVQSAPSWSAYWRCSCEQAHRSVNPTKHVLCCTI
jgi:hypothetical protein